MVTGLIMCYCLDLDKEEFVILSFQFYYEKRNCPYSPLSPYVPAEMTIIKFTLRDGVTNMDHLVFDFKGTVLLYSPP